MFTSVNKIAYLTDCKNGTIGQPFRVICEDGKKSVLRMFERFIIVSFFKVVPCEKYRFAIGDDIFIQGATSFYLGTISHVDGHNYHFTDGKRFPVAQLHARGELLSIPNPNLKNINL